MSITDKPQQHDIVKENKKPITTSTNSTNLTEYSNKTGFPYAIPIPRKARFHERRIDSNILQRAMD